MEQQLIQEIKDVLAVAYTEIDNREWNVIEPPHFHCTHSEDTVCKRIESKRKRDAVAKLATTYREYAEELSTLLENIDAKRQRYLGLMVDVDKLAAPIEEVVAAPVVTPPAVVTAPVPVPMLKPVAVPKGSPIGTPARR